MVRPPKILPASLLLAIIVSGTALRVYHLGYTGLWYDEACTAIRIGGTAFEMVSRFHVSLYPPLYYLILRFWSLVFGIGEFWLRFPSMVASVISIPIVYFFSRRLFDTKVGLISAFLLSISPYSITYAQDAKMYSISWLLISLSFLYFFKFSQDGSEKTLSLYVIFTTAVIYTSYPGFLIIAPQVVLAFFCRRQSFKRWLRALVAILLLFLPWVLFVLLKGGVFAAQGWWPDQVKHMPLLNKLFLLTSGNLIGRFSIIEVFIWVILLLSSVIAFPNKRFSLNFSRSHSLLVGWIVIPLAVCLLINVSYASFLNPMTIRYVGFIYIPVIILISKGLARLRPLIIALLLAFITMSTFKNHLIPYYGKVERMAGEWWSGVPEKHAGRGGNWRDLFARLKSEAGEDDLIILHRGFIHTPMKYYYPHPSSQVLYFTEVNRNRIGNAKTVFMVCRWPKAIPPDFWKQFESYRRHPILKYGHIGYYRLDKTD